MHPLADHHRPLSRGPCAVGPYYLLYLIVRKCQSQSPHVFLPTSMSFFMTTNLLSTSVTLFLLCKQVQLGDRMFWSWWGGGLSRKQETRMGTPHFWLLSPPICLQPPTGQEGSPWSGWREKAGLDFPRPLSWFSQNRAHWKKTQNSPHAYWKVARFSLIR